MPNFVFLARIAFEPEECGQNYECVVTVSDPEGNTLSPDSRVLMNPSRHKRYPDKGNTFTCHFGYDGITFKGTGYYRFSLLVGGHPIGSTIIEVFEDKSP